VQLLRVTAEPADGADTFPTSCWRSCPR